jgi:tRNA-2-methylthio-N6-dimethylallyladenosine synthase
MKEIQDLWDKGFKNSPWTKCSYLWYGGVEKRFHNCFKKKTAVDFDQLLEMTAVSFPK